MEVTINIDTHQLPERLEKKGDEIDERMNMLVFDIATAIRNRAAITAPVKKGELRNSHVVERKGNKQAIIYPDAPQAKFVIKGRGPVRPVHAKALRFVVGGKTVFAKYVKGTKPNPYFWRSIDGSAPERYRRMKEFEKWLTEV